MDEEGYLRITGRKKNLFKTSGGKYVSRKSWKTSFRAILIFTKSWCWAPDASSWARWWRRFSSGWRPTRASTALTFETREELVAHPEIHAFMQQLVDETTRWLPPHERIRQIVLLPRELTMGEGEVSATLKVKRRVVEEKYRDVIEEMFSRHAPQVERVRSR